MGQASGGYALTTAAIKENDHPSLLPVDQNPTLGLPAQLPGH
jgi:hypothetical protein